MKVPSSILHTVKYNVFTSLHIGKNYDKKSALTVQNSSYQNKFSLTTASLYNYRGVDPYGTGVHVPPIFMK